MSIYLDNGYLNFDSIVNSDYPFTFIVGGRGTGKTYGAIKYVLDNHIKFMFMRRTQTQCDIISKQQFSPFAPVADDEGLLIKSQPISKYTSEIAQCDEEGNLISDSLGYTCALSTISNLRGFSAEDVKILIYDEFIPEAHERTMRSEADAVFNAYETINRNRELKGEPPLIMICLANSMSLNNPLFMSLGVINTCVGMVQQGREVFRDKARGLQIIILQKSVISAEKSATAVYNLVGSDSSFAEMAIGNVFQDLDQEGIKPQDLKQYNPLAVVGELEVYHHKSEQRYYVTTHKSGGCKVYGSSQVNIKRFNRDFWYLPIRRLSGLIYFEDVASKFIFDSYIKLC